MGSSSWDSRLADMAEHAEPAEDRLMPAERKYLVSGETVSVEEAVARMKARKKDAALRIAGGLDDNSDRVRLQKKGNAPAPAKTEPPSDSLLQAELGLAAEQPGAGHEAVAERPGRGGRVTTAELRDMMASMDRRLSGVVASLGAQIGKKLERLDGDRPERQGPATDELTAFKGASHTVTFMLSGMEFAVRCLCMVRDDEAHSTVFVFSDDGDSFFTPPMQTELTVKYDGVPEPGKLYYFGMRFSIKALGLRFLGFLSYDQGQE